MKKQLFNITLQIAKEKLNNHPEYDCYPHFCFIIQNNKIVGYGVNMKGVPPIHFGYHTRLQGGIPKLHAEFAAYKKLKGLLKNKPFDIINVRLNRNGHIKNSGPCSCCYNFLRAVGCTNIYYSTELGWAKEL